MNPSSAGANGLDEVVCGCANLTYRSLRQLLAVEGNLTFDDLLDRTGAGTTCSACLLDLEYELTAQNRETAVDDIFTRNTKRKLSELFPTSRHRVFRWLDPLLPFVSTHLQELLPVIAGPEIKQHLRICNDHLLFDKSIPIGTVQADIVIRDLNGANRHRERCIIGAGQTLDMELSQYLPMPQQGEVLVVGSATVRRRFLKLGVRGTTRPHYSIDLPLGHCTVHVQAPSGHEQRRFNFLSRPDEDRIFVIVNNANSRPLDMELSFSSEAGERQCSYETSLRVPPLGARVAEYNANVAGLADLKGQPVQISARSNGTFKTHLMCTDKAFTRASIDHF